jgi:hypothetical protein
MKSAERECICLYKPKHVSGSNQSRAFNTEGEENGHLILFTHLYPIRSKERYCYMYKRKEKREQDDVETSTW